MLDVLVNASSTRVGGGMTYLRSQLAHLAQMDVRLTLLTARWNQAAWEEEAVGRIVPLRSPSVPMRVLEEQVRIRSLATSHDVVYCPGNIGPLMPTSTPIVVVVQNSNYYGEGSVLGHNRSISRRARIAASRRSLTVCEHVVAISEHIEREILATVPSVSGKTSVIQSGAPEWPISTEREIGSRGAMEYRYVLSLANDHPHKRLDDVALAWSRTSAGDCRLVFCGDIPPAREAQLREKGKHGGPIEFLGPLVRREDVRSVLAGAEILVSASELEAHPLTPAEAGSLGCPLLLSDIPPHREVAGDHARYFPPGDVGELARDLQRMLASRLDRQAWIWPVSWEDNARETRTLFEQVHVATKRDRRSKAR